jgi:hypothetical protein
MMNEPIERAVAIAIESYAHAPRTLSLLEVVRQVAAVFPDQDQARIAHGVRESRRMFAADRSGRCYKKVMQTPAQESRKIK